MSSSEVMTPTESRTALVGMTIQHQTGNRRRQSRMQMVAQAPQLDGDLGQPLAGQPGGYAQSDHRRHILGAGPQAPFLISAGGDRLGFRCSTFAQSLE